MPATVKFTNGVILLGGGPWGSAGNCNLPTLDEEVKLVRDCMLRGISVLGIGLGAQILALASGGKVYSSPLQFCVGKARRFDKSALNGYLPDTFPIATYMRDGFEAPPHAEILAVDTEGNTVAFQVAENCFGFAGHLGLKVAIVEDLIMEFEEAPDDIVGTLEDLRREQGPIEDALVPIMTGIVQRTLIFT